MEWEEEEGLHCLLSLSYVCVRGKERREGGPGDLINEPRAIERKGRGGGGGGDGKGKKGLHQSWEEGEGEEEKDLKKLCHACQPLFYFGKNSAR